MELEKCICISHATKTIKKFLILDNITITMQRGGIYGLHGVNGSGKSMLLKAIAGLIRLNEGSISVFGNIVGKDVDFPPDMGCMFGASMWNEYTGFENLEILASIRRIIDKHDIRMALDRVGLNPNDTRVYRKYSLGMKQRLDLAQAIMEKPNLLLLDEPSNALDADGLQLLCSIIKQEHERGTTIVMASHNTPELEALCDRVFHLSEGKIVDDTYER